MMIQFNDDVHHHYSTFSNTSAQLTPSHLTSCTMERQIIYHTRSLSQRIIQSSARPLRASSLASSRPATASTTSSCASLRPASRRSIHTTAPVLMQSRPPKSRDRGPKSDEDTQTDFNALDVLRNTAAPATSIDATTSDGFALNNQMRVSGCGLLLVGGEAFRWRPWKREGEDSMTGRLRNKKGQWEISEGGWGVLELVWPKPGRSTPRAWTAQREHGLHTSCSCSTSVVRDSRSNALSERRTLTICRYPHHRHRPQCSPPCACGSNVPQRSWYTVRSPGYKECGCAVQSISDGEGCRTGRCRADSNRVERRKGNCCG